MPPPRAWARSAKGGCEQSQQGSPLLDHLVGALLQEPGHLEAECLRRLEIDHELDLGRLLDRDVGGPSALKDAVDVAGKLAEGVADVRPVGQETAGKDVLAALEHGR